MADNTELDSGAGGDSIRSVEKTGVKTQVVTLDVGGAGAESLVAGTVPVSGTVTAELSAADNSVLDDIAASVAGTIAVSNAGLTELAAAIDTEVQCDIVGALPAGTNAIGKLAANSGVDIGDVDVLSVIPGTGATNLGKATDSAAGATDTGIAALAVRDDVLGALTPAAGDYAPLRVSSKGALWVAPVSDILQDAETAVSVAASGLTTLATIDNSMGYKRLKFQFDVATQNVDDCEVQVKGHASAVSMVITPTSWASLPSGGYITATGVHTTSTGAYVDGDLNTVDAAQSGFFDMDVEGFTEIIVKLSAASDSASVTPRWTLS